MSEWKCDYCGFAIDTPNHQLGCPLGRGESVVEANQLTASAAVADRYARESAGERFWHQRYDTQHRTLHLLEDELREERRRYRELQELSGGAIARAHYARGAAEKETEKLRDKVRKLKDEVDRLRRRRRQPRGA